MRNTKPSIWYIFSTRFSIDFAGTETFRFTTSNYVSIKYGYFFCIRIIRLSRSVYSVTKGGRLQPDGSDLKSVA